MSYSPRDDEAAPHRSKKNTKKWCRGKVGVEHVIEVRMNKNRSWWKERGRTCWRAEWWPEMWHCQHQRVCINCNKVVEPSLYDECPDFTKEITIFRKKV